jgi:hypothetical protein
MKTKRLGWEECHGIQHTGIEGSQVNTVRDQRQVLKTGEIYITELYDRANRSENKWKQEKMCYWIRNFAPLVSWAKYIKIQSLPHSNLSILSYKYQPINGAQGNSHCFSSNNNNNNNNKHINTLCR